MRKQTEKVRAPGLHGDLSVAIFHPGVGISQKYHILGSAR